MRQKFIAAAMVAFAISAQGQALNFSIVKSFESQLDDVMEIIDTSELKLKLPVVEREFEQNPSEINKARLGIIYHETALNLSFLSKTNYKGYAQKSFDLLSELHQNKQTSLDLMPFISSYRASAISLVGAETRKLSYLSNAFKLFDEVIKNYGLVSYLPEFLRGSVAENLPWIFVFKRKTAKNDFESIILKYNQNQTYANAKAMSFTFWAWANQHQSKKYRIQALEYLEKAIALDPNYKGGRKKAEDLKMKFEK